MAVPGLGYFQLPATLDGLSEWQDGYRRALPGAEALPLMDALSADMAHALATGQGLIDEDDLDGTIIIHRPDGTNIVVHARDLAHGGDEAAVWEAIEELVAAGYLTPCADDGSEDACPDGGYRMTLPGES